jgi:hypothetical protein
LRQAFLVLILTLAYKSLRHNLCRVLGVDADLFISFAHPLKSDETINLGEESVVFPDPDIVSGMELGTPLPDQNAACGYQLATEPFHTQTLGITVPAVSRTSDSLFMSKQLQIHFEHPKHLQFTRASARIIE